jgi:hypothetical protein
MPVSADRHARQRLRLVRIAGMASAKGASFNGTWCERLDLIQKSTLGLRAVDGNIGNALLERTRYCDFPIKSPGNHHLEAWELVAWTSWQRWLWRGLGALPPVKARLFRSVECLTPGTRVKPLAGLAATRRVRTQWPERTRATAELVATRAPAAQLGMRERQEARERRQALEPREAAELQGAGHVQIATFSAKASASIHRPTVDIAAPRWVVVTTEEARVSRASVD